jgi:hypothetical protein
VPLTCSPPQTNHLLHLDEKVPLSRADKEKEQSLIDLHNQYVSGTITREKYTRTHGYKYQARTDMWIRNNDSCVM